MVCHVYNNAVRKTLERTPFYLFIFLFSLCEHFFGGLIPLHYFTRMCMQSLVTSRCSRQCCCDCTVKHRDATHQVARQCCLCVAALPIVMKQASYSDEAIRTASYSISQQATNKHYCQATYCSMPCMITSAHAKGEC